MIADTQEALDNIPVPLNCQLVNIPITQFGFSLPIEFPTSLLCYAFEIFLGYG